MLIERSAEEIAALVCGQLVGECRTPLQGVASLSEATHLDVSFLGQEKYREQVLPSQAGLVLVPRDFTIPPPEGRAWVACADPSAAFSMVVAVYTPPAPEYPPGIHPSAIISSSAKIAPGVHIGAGVVIDEEVEIGENSIILANVYLGRQCVLGEGCLLYPNVVIRERCLLGKRVILHPGVVIGADGFGYQSGPQGHEKIPQVGIVQLDDDVEIGANSCVDRARFGRTWIKSGSKIDNLVQIGHNVELGQGAMIVGQAGIAGSTQLGDAVVVAGQAGLAGHLKIGSGSVIMAQAGVSKNLSPGSIVFGSPAIDRREYARQQLYINRLDKMNASLKQLQSELAELKQAGLESPQ